MLGHLQTVTVDAVTVFHCRDPLHIKNVHFDVPSGATAFFGGRTARFERDEVSAYMGLQLQPHTFVVCVPPNLRALQHRFMSSDGR